MWYAYVMECYLAIKNSSKTFSNINKPQKSYAKFKNPGREYHVLEFQLCEMCSSVSQDQSQVESGINYIQVLWILLWGEGMF